MNLSIYRIDQQRWRSIESLIDERRAGLSTADANTATHRSGL
ncbi:MAG: hypothetical protein WAN46_18760 [Gammaproteobacteria bacterium]